jgi:hypothetical protein
METNLHYQILPTKESRTILQNGKLSRRRKHLKVVSVDGATIMFVAYVSTSFLTCLHALTATHILYDYLSHTRCQIEEEVSLQDRADRLDALCLTPPRLVTILGKITFQTLLTIIEIRRKYA